MKFLVPFLFLIAGTTPLFAQTDYTNDTLTYKEGVYVYDIDFFGLERTLNWDTINQKMQIGEVELRFHNHTLAPVEVKKVWDNKGVIRWNCPEEAVCIPPNGNLTLRTNFNFEPGSFKANLNIKFKHLRKKHELKLQTFGYAEKINSRNAEGKKHGKWIEYNAKGQLVEFLWYDNGNLNEYLKYHYSSEGLRLKMDRINLIDTYYLASGAIEFEMRPDSKTEYYENGIVKSLETEKQVIYYDKKGIETRRRNQQLSHVLDAYEMIIIEEYYGNGDLKMQGFSNDKELHYSDQIEGCLTKRIIYKGRTNEITFKYENCEIVEATTLKMNNSRMRAYTISSGYFKAETLMDGAISYYDNTHKLRFKEQIKNGSPTGAVTIDGVTYNEKDEQGRKQGVWISNQTCWGDWRNSAGNEIWVKGYFENGEPRDTIFYYYPGGKIKEIGLKTKDVNSPSSISYYRSGHISEKAYSFHQANQSKVYKRENYADSQTLTLSSAEMNDYYYTYKNGKIVSRKSPIIRVDHARSIPGENKRQYTVARGSFRKEHLYNGKITYYNDADEALRTVRVSEGRINGDRIVIFEDIALEMELYQSGSILDRDRNGYITRSEIRNIEKLSIHGSWVASVTDLKAFPRLKELYVNGRKVPNELLKQPVELLTEVQRFAAMSTIRSGRGWRGGGGIIDPIPEPPDPGWPIGPEPPQIYDFVEVEPEFPGGVEAMMEFISTNLEYPVADRDMGEQGVVYVRFIVNKNGDIEKVRIRRGISDGLDKEAKRIIQIMPRWKPGEQAGKKVSVYFTLPIHFRLE